MLIELLEKELKEVIRKIIYNEKNNIDNTENYKRYTEIADELDYLEPWSY